jgi:hypothetical protein
MGHGNREEAGPPAQTQCVELPNALPTARWWCGKIPPTNTPFTAPLPTARETIKTIRQISKTMLFLPINFDPSGFHLSAIAITASGFSSAGMLPAS